MARASRRSTAAQAAQQSPARPSRSRKVKEEPEPVHDEPMAVDDDNEDAEGEDEEEAPPVASSSRRRKPRASTSSRRRSTRAKTEESEPEEEDHHARRRVTKQVSYREVPVDLDENDDDDDDEEEDDEEEEEEEEKPVTPSRRTRTRPAAKKKEKDEPYKKESRPGRGGFSIKGAAAAAARARWDKVRREREARGEDNEETTTTPKTTTRKAAPQPQPVKKDPRGALENVIEGQAYLIKGVEYVAAVDELILPDDPKGDTKVDALGRLLGGREYKLVTFTSPTRQDPERVYALTIDAARACGYTDSLAFLRRCPQIVKLSCNPEEREMLINVGRITGNLKHRMVTMVAMRNVFKLMGARLVKGGKWVDDDYNEEQALVDCQANGWTPHGDVLDEELAVNQYPSAGGPGRPPANAGLLADAAAVKSQLSSFYTVGGPTTHFGGNGLDPWSDHMHGRRGRLRQLGVTEEDWMLRTAEESRRIDETLRAYREERIGPLEGVDATRGWVYAAERQSSGELKEEDPKEEENRTPHPLANEVTFDNMSEPLTPIPPETPNTAAIAEAAAPESVGVPGGKIIVESVAETTRSLLKAGGWKPGVINAAYEPHTQLPHVPLRTQPTFGTRDRLSYNPLLGLNGAAQYVHAPGIASVEFVFAPAGVQNDWLGFGDGTTGAAVTKARTAAVNEAEEWERTARAKRRRISVANASTTAAASTA